MAPTSANARRIKVAKFMKMMIFVCWGLMGAGLVSVITAGHMNAASLAALSLAILCLAGVFLMLFQGVRKWGRDSADGLAGKELTFLYVFAAASMGLIVLTIFLR
ncbi:hypothetical protein [Arthrobacter sp. 9V]|uniref:hypothetical protein n=1 Tax=Arthrobacter sp. 9V TaxID=2653132 RepID=UPI001357AA9C|nr:hypothetical protein [Arthrobacter sp. 9V]